MDAILRLELALSVVESRASELDFKRLHMPMADRTGRAHYAGYVAGLENAAELLRPILEELRAEQPSMAGDLRDFPAEEPFNSYDEKVAS